VSKFIHKPSSFENLKLDLGEPMLNHVINQVRLEMVMQRVKQETLKSKFLEVMETQKELKAKQEGILKKQDEMA